MHDPTHPRFVLHADGAAIALVAVLLYQELGVAWWVFAAGFLVPDLSLLAYLGSVRLGAKVYNATHSYLGGSATFGVGLLLENVPLMTVGLIWVAHVGIDRAIGFGLKYPDDFRRTHLQRV